MFSPPHNAIWTKQQHTDQWVMFEKQIHIQGQKETIDAYIGVETKYWLFVNDRLVVNDGGLHRESRPGCGYYDIVSLSNHLKQGNNQITLWVWFWDNEGRNNVNSKEAGLWFYCPQLNIQSDATWRVSTHPAFFHVDKPHPSYLYGGHHIGYDAQLENQTQWHTPIQKKCDRWGKLYPRPIPFFVFSDLKKYEKVEHKANGYVCDLPYAMHVCPGIHIHHHKACKITIYTDRYQVNGGPGDHHNQYLSHRFEYITKPGENTFVFPYWLYGEKVFYECQEKLDQIDFIYRETGYDTSFEGHFHCSFDWLDRLHEKSKRTLYICMRENFMDCPDRERGQWIGDVSTQLPQVFYTLSHSAHSLCKKAIMDFIELRDGKILKGNVPGCHKSELPAQSLNAISPLGMIQSYYEHTGDLWVFQYSYDAIKDYLSLWSMKENGLVACRKGDWYWFDHKDQIDEIILENAWYVLALRQLDHMHQVLQKKEDISFLTKRIQHIKKGLEVFTDEKGYKSNDDYDERANAMMLIADLCHPSKIDPCLDLMTSQINCTPYMEYYVLYALFMHQRPLQAMDRMLLRYQPLIENKNTTLWEDFTVLGTKNHAWSGGPLALMYRFIAGIFPKDPGYETVGICPQYAGIDHIEATVPTVRGNISLTLIYEGKKLQINIKKPDHIKAIIKIPNGYMGYVNGIQYQTSEVIL